VVNVIIEGGSNMEETNKKSKATPKGGQKSIKEQHKDLGFAPIDLNNYAARRSALDLDDALWKELEEKNLVPRWINFNTYRKQGFHKSHWKPFKRNSNPSNGAIFAVGPDGLTFKQDLVLAVKPKDWNDAHRKYLKDQAMTGKKIAKVKAKELKDSLESAGISSVVKEGYED